jgi:hypothetical protein
MIRKFFKLISQLLVIHAMAHVQQVRRLLFLGFRFGFARVRVRDDVVFGVGFATAESVRALQFTVQRASSESARIDPSRVTQQRQRGDDDDDDDARWRERDARATKARVARRLAARHRSRFAIFLAIRAIEDSRRAREGSRTRRREVPAGTRSMGVQLSFFFLARRRKARTRRRYNLS